MPEYIPDPNEFARRVKAALDEQRTKDGEKRKVLEPAPEDQTRGSMGGLLGSVGATGKAPRDWDQLTEQEQDVKNRKVDDAEAFGITEDVAKAAETAKIAGMTPEELMEYRNHLLWKRKEAESNQRDNAQQATRYQTLNDQGKAAQVQQNYYLERNMKDDFLPDFLKVRQANKAWDMEGRTTGANASEYIKPMTAVHDVAQSAKDKLESLLPDWYTSANKKLIDGTKAASGKVAEVVEKGMPRREPTDFKRGDENAPAPDGTDFGDLVDKAIQNAKKPQR